MTTALEARIAVGVRRRGAESVIAEVAGTEPWQPRPLGPSGGVERVALVGSRASLLGGDEVTLEIDLEAGCALEILELGATVAHHARGGPPARLSTVARLGAGARLIWLGQPLIAAAGCHAVRETRIELASGAAVLLGEAIVLGRAGERPGRLRAHTRITLEERPVLDETVDTDPGWLLASSVVSGGAGMLEALSLAGMRDPEPPPGALQAHEPATLWRGVGPARAGLADLASGLARRWRGQILA
ncbi:MAG: urease accessory protein [Solirubrobacteraceae bacterium]|jgi:urease accessory protein|nr:urease accessory protein [Solirubrobacteraceae bacterium]